MAKGIFYDYFFVFNNDNNTRNSGHINKSQILGVKMKTETKTNLIASGWSVVNHADSGWAVTQQQRETQRFFTQLENPINECEDKK